MFILDTITHRLKRGCETMAYPNGPAPALPDRPTARLPTPAAPGEVAIRLLQAIHGWRRLLARDGMAPLREAWMARGPGQGARLTLRGGAGVTTGLYRGLDEDGALLLEVDGRVRRVTSGEVAA